MVAIVVVVVVDDALVVELQFALVEQQQLKNVDKLKIRQKMKENKTNVLDMMALILHQLFLLQLMLLN